MMDVVAVRGRAAAFGPLLAASLVLGACGGEETQGGVTPIPEAESLTVRTVDWNPTGAALGSVAAVAELGGTIAVLADKGATVFSGGLVTAEDAAITGWKSAAVIPAADGNGMWVAGIDATGHVYRLRAGSFFEGISDLYGLEGEAVQGIAPLGGSAVAFALDAELAVADGATVTRYDIDADEGGVIAGGNGRAATAHAVAGKVSVLKAATAQAIVYDLPGAEQAVFDAAGKLVVRTADSIYIEDSAGGLALRYTGAMGPLRELAASDVLVWFVEGTELAALGATSVLRTTGAGVTEGARLVGSPSGDVWTIDGGALARFAAETGDSEDRATWEKDVQPIYLKACTPCHEPGGSAGAELSTYGAWVARRDKIQQKVAVEKSMPPVGIEFSDAEREAVANWAAGGKP